MYVQGHLYTLVEKDGSKDTTLEKYYVDIEGIADQVIEKIVRAARKGQLSRLTITEKIDWDNFVYRQCERVPDLSIRTLGNSDDALNARPR